MTTRVLPEAEWTLRLGVRRALELIRKGRPDDARRALEVAGSAAELIDTQREELKP